MPVQVEEEPFTLAGVCPEEGFTFVAMKIAKTVKVTKLDGTKVPLPDLPGGTPLKFAFRTGVKLTVPAPCRRVFIMNCVEATEAPASRGVRPALALSHASPPALPACRPVVV